MTDESDMTYERLERADADYEADTFGLSPGVAAVYMEHMADVFCKTCAKDVLGDDLFSRVKEENVHTDEYGNVAAVLSTEEWDCPGANCGHCGVPIDVRVIHYDSVCRVDWCPYTVECTTCGGVIYPEDSACETNGKDGLTCKECAKRAGIDVGAFCRTARSILR